MTMSIRIVSIPVSDQASAKRFYEEILGFNVVRDNPMGPDQRWVELKPQGGGPSITLVTWFDSMPPGSVQGLVLDSDDIDESCAALAERGLALTDIETAPWGRFSTFKDPDGNGWVLQGPLQGDA